MFYKIIGKKNQYYFQAFILSLRPGTTTSASSFPAFSMSRCISTIILSMKFTAWVHVPSRRREKSRRVGRPRPATATVWCVRAASRRFMMSTFLPAARGRSRVTKRSRYSISMMSSCKKKDE